MAHLDSSVRNSDGEVLGMDILPGLNYGLPMVFSCFGSLTGDAALLIVRFNPATDNP